MLKILIRSISVRFDELKSKRLVLQIFMAPPFSATYLTAYVGPIQRQFLITRKIKRLPIKSSDSELNNLIVSLILLF